MDTRCMTKGRAHGVDREAVVKARNTREGGGTDGNNRLERNGEWCFSTQAVACPLRRPLCLGSSGPPGPALVPILRINHSDDSSRSRRRRTARFLQPYLLIYTLTIYTSPQRKNLSTRPVFFHRRLPMQLLLGVCNINWFWMYWSWIRRGKVCRNS